MSGANIGTAYMTVSPRFENLGKSVNDALGNVDTTQSGVKMGKSLDSGIASGTGGFAKSGALIGAFSAATTKAMELIGSSVGGAAARLYTMNNYPKVMQTLGYSADDAKSSIQKMSDHLIGLPTALNDMTSTVQGIAAVTGDLNEATDSGLALNDMLLASGSNTQIAGAAMEQFRQMLAKGKPDMQDWKSLTSAMPGQMAQLAKAMLGPTANANDLYTALGGGGSEATKTMDQLMRKMVELDTTGGDGITSFAEQAKSATGGIQSSMSNAQTAITRGLADIMDSIGTDTISGVIKGTGKAFEDGLKSVAGGIGAAKPTIDGFISGVKGIAPALIPAVAAMASLSVASKGLASFAAAAESIKGGGSIASGIASSLMRLSGAMGTTTSAGKAMAGMAGVLTTSMGGPLVAGIGILVSVLAMAGVALYDAQKKTAAFSAATSGLVSASEKAAPAISSVSNAYDSLNVNSETTAKSIADVNSALDASVSAGEKLSNTINDRKEATEQSIGLLEAYRKTINDYAGQSGLGERQQSELKIAIDGVNEACGTQYSVVDAANGAISDENGTIMANTGALNENIDAIERHLQVEALEEDYKDIYKRRVKDVGALSEAQKTAAAAAKEYGDAEAAGLNGEALQSYADRAQEANDAMIKQQQIVDSESNALDNISASMAGVASGAEAMSLQITSMSTESPDITRKLSDMGTTADDLSAKLASAGVSSQQMSAVSGPAFSNMLTTCGGDINSLAAMVEMYNSQPIVDKDGNISVNKTELIDAQGNVYTWNGTELVGKDGKVEVDTVSLLDAQGNVVTWNGTSLDYKGTNADVNSQSVVDATNNINDYNNTEPADKHATTVIDVIENIIHNVTGGNASGGFLKLHSAGGFIIDRPTNIGTDANGVTHIAGEDGAEWVSRHADGTTSIIPVQNRKYLEPYASTIASMIPVKGGNTYNVTINGSYGESPEKFARDFVRKTRQLQRTAG